MELMPEVRYAIDGDDRLVEVNEGWTAFALANHGEQLDAASVVGRLIWDFISDDITSHLYRAVVRLVRRTERQVHFSFRCDAPSRRRLLAMEMFAGAGDKVVFRVTALKEEERPSVPMPEPQPDAEPGLLTVCSWCERVRLPSGEWVGAEAAMQWRGEVEFECAAKLTHGMCPACYGTLVAGLADPQVVTARIVNLGDLSSS